MTVTEAILAMFCIALVIFAERLFPFVLFSKRAPGRLIHIFERYVPPVVMLGLLIYSLRSVSFAEPALWVPPVAGVAFSAATYVWKKNTFISIFGATILYMVLLRVL